MKRIKLDEESDAELHADADSTWISVGDNFSVYIKRVRGSDINESGINVDIYVRGHEDCNALTSCYAFDSDAEEFKEEEDLEVD